MTKKLNITSITNELAEGSAFFRQHRPEQPKTAAEPTSPLPKGSREKNTKPSPPVKKPEIMKSRNHEPPIPSEIPPDTLQKYSTLIKRSYIKKIKLQAAERDLKDYEIIEIALKAHFDKKG